MHADPDCPPRELAGLVIDQAGFRPYRLRLRDEWTGRGAHVRREGWIVILSAGRYRGYGDCAPLPEAGTEGPDEAGRVITHVIQAIPGRTIGGCGTLLDSLHRKPALRCGLETAFLDLLGRYSDRPVARLLDPGASSVVHVNALLGPLDAGVIHRAGQAVASGYRVLKVKTGSRPAGLEVRRLRGISQRLPEGIQLRLDANRAWNLGTALRVFRALRGLPIESVEEPLRSPSPGRMALLQRMSPWPIALDETLAHSGAGAYLHRPVVRRLVLKPMVLGGPVAALALARRASRAGLQTVVTTTLDSAVGRAAALHLAAACNSDIAHGLATGDWLRDDLATGPSPRFGRMRLPSTPGLGLDTWALEGEACFVSGESRIQ